MGISFASWITLLAQSDEGEYSGNLLEQIARQVRIRGDSLDLWDILPIVITITLVAGAIWLLTRFLGRPTQPFRSPKRLFQELCRAHKLDHASVRLLLQLAAANKIRDAAKLFIKPELFDSESVRKHLPNSAEQLTQLRGQLFR